MGRVITCDISQQFDFDVTHPLPRTVLTASNNDVRLFEAARRVEHSGDTSGDWGFVRNLSRQ